MSFKQFLEVRDEYVDEVTGHWDGEPTSLPFNNIFGDKLRIAVPAYQSKNFRWVEILLQSWLGRGQFTVNWTRNSVSYLIKTQRGEKEEESRIGLMLEKLPGLAKKKAYSTGDHLTHPYIKEALKVYQEVTGQTIEDLVKWVSSIYAYNVPQSIIDDYKKWINTARSYDDKATIDKLTKELEAEKEAQKKAHYHEVGERAKEEGEEGERRDGGKAADTHESHPSF